MESIEGLAVFSQYIKTQVDLIVWYGLLDQEHVWDGSKEFYKTDLHVILIADFDVDLEHQDDEEAEKLANFWEFSQR